MAPIRLHGSRLSPFVEKAYRGLRYKGIDFEFVDLTNPLDLARLNPVTRKMPVAFFDGERVYDSSFILRRADELSPSPPLFAAEPQTAAAQRQLEDWADESLYWYGMALRWTRKNAAATAEQILAGVAAPLRFIARQVVPRRLAAMTRAQGLGRLPDEVLVRELAERLDDLVALLGDRAFLYADQPSAADFAVHGQLQMLRSGPTPEAERLIVERPVFSEYTKRVEQASGGAG
jgi:glutathione S-transferase